MGGPGSGRLNKTDTFLKQNSAPFNTVSPHVASIGNVDATKDANTVLQEVRAKQAAVDMVREWLREVEGRADQHKNQDSGIGKEEEGEEDFVVEK